MKQLLSTVLFLVTILLLQPSYGQTTGKTKPKPIKRDIITKDGTVLNGKQQTNPSGEQKVQQLGKDLATLNIHPDSITVTGIDSTGNLVCTGGNRKLLINPDTGSATGYVDDHRIKIKPYSPVRLLGFSNNGEVVVGDSESNAVLLGKEAANTKANSHPARIKLIRVPPPVIIN